MGKAGNQRKNPERLPFLSGRPFIQKGRVGTTTRTNEYMMVGRGTWSGSDSGWIKDAGSPSIFHLLLWSPLEPPWAHQWPAEEGYESHGPLCYVCSAHAPTAACVLLLHLYVRTMQVACRPCMYSQSICMSESSQKHGRRGDWRGLATVGWPPRSRCAMCGALRLVPGLRGAPLPRLFAAPSSVHCYGRVTVGLSAGRSADCCTIQGGVRELGCRSKPLVQGWP